MAVQSICWISLKQSGDVGHPHQARPLLLAAMRGRGQQRVFGCEAGEPAALRRLYKDSAVEDRPGVQLRAEGARRKRPMRLEWEPFRAEQNIMSIVMIIIRDAPSPQTDDCLAAVTEVVERGESVPDSARDE